MIKPTSPELYYLVLTAGLTGILWVGYIVSRIRELGQQPVLGNPNPETLPLVEWADRMMRAHRNAVENLLVFAALVLAIHFNQAMNETAAMAAMVFFYARLSHAVIYTMGIPQRTLAFFVGFVCQVVLFLQFLG